VNANWTFSKSVHTLLIKRPTKEEQDIRD